MNFNLAIVLQAENIVKQDDMVFPNLTFPDSSDIAGFSSNSTASITLPSDLLQRRSVGS